MHVTRRISLVLLVALAGAVTVAPAVAQAAPATDRLLAGRGRRRGVQLRRPVLRVRRRRSGQSAPCSFTPQPPSTLNPAEGCTAIGAVPDGSGYWLLNTFRQPTPYGGAGFVGGQSGCTSLNGAQGTWVAMASSLTGAGYWMVSSNGAVMGCGDAPAPYGGVATEQLAAPIVGMAVHPGRPGVLVGSGRRRGVRLR